MEQIIDQFAEQSELKDCFAEQRKVVAPFSWKNLIN
jgi:hypothetical protein